MANSRWGLYGLSSFMDPQISCVCLFIVFNTQLFFFTLYRLAYISPGRLGYGVGCDNQATMCSFILPPLLQAASDSLPGASVKNYPSSHFTDEATEAQRNKVFFPFWSQTVLGSKAGASSHGFWLYNLHLGMTWSLLSHLFELLAPTQSQSYFKHKFKWHCDLLESIENFRMEHVFLLRTSVMRF